MQNHACALKSDGTAHCWGGNSSGQLGNGSITNSGIPVLVSELTNAISISAGGNHTCALTTAGVARCWGNAWIVGSLINLGWVSTAVSQVVGFDRDESSPLTSISTSQSTTPAGGPGTGVTLHVQLTHPSGEPWAGVTPIIAATDSRGDNSGSCLVSNGAGESSCKLFSTFAETKEIWLTYPVLTKLSVPADGRVTFTADVASGPSLRGLASIRANTCSPQPYAIGFVDSFQNPSSTPNGGSITISAASALAAYVDPKCTIPLGSVFNFSPGESTALFYFKASSPGVYSVGLELSITGVFDGHNAGITLTVEP